MILVIISDTEVRQNIEANVLQPLGLEVAIAENEKTGLEMAIVQDPQLILVDGKNGDITKKTIIPILRQSGSSSPIIYVADASDAELLEAFRFGISDFIKLPLDIAEAQSTIIRIIEKSDADRERQFSNQKLLLDEAVRITLTTLSHYLNNYLTALSGNLTLLSEALQNQDSLERQMEILTKSKRDLANIKKVIEVLVNTTIFKLTEYDDSAKMIDIDGLLFSELNRIMDSDIDSV
jgi:DNA-binding response OmpR family regulator